MSSELEAKAQVENSATILDISSDLSNLLLPSSPIAKAIRDISKISNTISELYLDVLAPNNLVPDIEKVDLSSGDPVTPRIVLSLPISEAITNLVYNTSNSNFPGGKLTLIELGSMVSKLGDNVKFISEYLADSDNGLVKIFSNLKTALTQLAEVVNQITKLSIPTVAIGSISAEFNGSDSSISEVDHSPRICVWIISSLKIVTNECERSASTGVLIRESGELQIESNAELLII